MNLFRRVLWTETSLFRQRSPISHPSHCCLPPTLLQTSGATMNRHPTHPSLKWGRFLTFPTLFRSSLLLPLHLIRLLFPWNNKVISLTLRNLFPRTLRCFILQIPTCGRIQPRHMLNQTSLESRPSLLKSIIPSLAPVSLYKQARNQLVSLLPLSLTRNLTPP